MKSRELSDSQFWGIAALFIYAGIYALSLFVDHKIEQYKKEGHKPVKEHAPSSIAPIESEISPNINTLAFDVVFELDGPGTTVIRNYLGAPIESSVMITKIGSQTIVQPLIDKEKKER